MPTRNILLEEIEAYMEAMGWPPTTFGREVLGDTAFVSRLRMGRDVKSSTADRIRQYIKNNPPPKKRRGQRAARPRLAAAVA
jgi:hypothetical protein